VTKLVVDSSAWIEFFRATGSTSHLAVLDAIRQREILVPDLVKLEVLRGFTDKKKYQLVNAQFSSFNVVEIGGSVAVSSAIKVNADLRKQGYTIRGTIDLLVGTWCLQNDVALLHCDRDFDAIEKCLGLKTWRGLRPLPDLA
jgi:predicted nucleic acid-binding protein